jgi:uncharacterized small protein (DUF1192 family)
MEGSEKMIRYKVITWQEIGECIMKVEELEKRVKKLEEEVARLSKML